MLLNRWRRQIEAQEAQSGERLVESRRAFNTFLEGGARTRKETKTRGLGLRSGKVVLKDRFVKMSDDAFRRHQMTREDWEKKPGEKGFNAEATQKMRKSGFTSRNKQFFIKCPSGGTFKPMAYQRTVSWLVSPKTPVDRLLVVHRTGSGKTFTMLRVLDNYYSDPRPKAIIFPTASVKRNFYGELLKFPNKYRNACMKRLSKRQAKLMIMDADGMDLEPAEKKEAVAARKIVVDFLAMKGMLKHAGEPGYMKAPLRAFTYTQAGGATITHASGPREALFKIGYDPRNVYDNKIVLMDEFHNLVKPAPAVQRYKSKLVKLAGLLKSCRNTVLVGLTATPIVDSPQDGRDLMAIVKGPGGSVKNDEGFISFFDSMPRTIYPEALPCTTAHLGNIIEVPMGSNQKKPKEGDKKKKKRNSGDGNAEIYAKKHRAAIRSGNPSAKTIMRLQNYCNSAGYYTHAGRMSAAGKLAEGTAQIYATKLYQIATDVAARNEKALILIHRTAGYKIMVELMNNIVKSQCREVVANQCWVGLYEKTAEAEDKLKKFNSPENLRGERMKAMVVDTKEFSEGVSFKGVRRLILVNPSLTFALHKQRIGRALRACAYEKLPKEQRNVKIDIYVASHPEITSIDLTVLENLKKEQARIQGAMDAQFKDIAVDRKVLEPVATSKTCA